MDNSTHHHGQVVQLNNASSTNVHPVQQQNSSKSSGEFENFLTIRLLMQGKVSFKSVGFLMVSFLFCFWIFQEVGSIIGKRGDNIKAIREEVKSDKKISIETKDFL